MQTHRVVFPRPGVVEVQEFDVASPGPDEVLVRTEVSLISPGTEGAGLMDRPNTGGQFPKRPGYSNVGVVEEVGANVKPFTPGDRVASHAGHGDLVVVSVDRGVVRVPEGLKSEHAAFSSLAAISLQAVRPKAERSAGFWPVEEDVRLVLELMAAGRLQVAPLLTTRLPAYEAAEGYRLIMEKKRDALGILLDWRETV